MSSEDPLQMFREIRAMLHKIQKDLNDIQRQQNRADREYDRKEAAERLHVSVRQVERMMADDTLSVVRRRVGGVDRVYITEAECARWLRANEHSPKAHARPSHAVREPASPAARRSARPLPGR